MNIMTNSIWNRSDAQTTTLIRCRWWKRLDEKERFISLFFSISSRLCNSVSWNFSQAIQIIFCNSSKFNSTWNLTFFTLQLRELSWVSSNVMKRRFPSFHRLSTIWTESFAVQSLVFCESTSSCGVVEYSIGRVENWNFSLLVVVSWIMEIIEFARRRRVKEGQESMGKKLNMEINSILRTKLFAYYFFAFQVLGSINSARERHRKQKRLNCCCTSSEEVELNGWRINNVAWPVMWMKKRQNTTTLLPTSAHFHVDLIPVSCAICWDIWEVERSSNRENNLTRVEFFTRRLCVFFAE